MHFSAAGRGVLTRAQLRENHLLKNLLCNTASNDGAVLSLASVRNYETPDCSVTAIEVKARQLSLAPCSRPSSLAARSARHRGSRGVRRWDRAAHGRAPRQPRRPHQHAAHLVTLDDLTKSPLAGRDRREVPRSGRGIRRLRHRRTRARLVQPTTSGGSSRQVWESLIDSCHRAIEATRALRAQPLERREQPKSHG